MKNLTLSIPEELLEKAREYASQHGTSLNEMIRNLLKKTVNQDEFTISDRLKALENDLAIDTRKRPKRDELYER